jgi:hypothetical protein
MCLEHISAETEWTNQGCWNVLSIQRAGYVQHHEAPHAFIFIIGQLS